jgi:hypothetical protein
MTRESEGFRAEMLRAAIKRAQIQHPNLLATRVTKDDTGEARLEIEACRSPRLLETLANRPLGLNASAKLVGDVAAAAEALASHGLVVRDLRPAKIFVDGKRGAILADLAFPAELVPVASEEPHERRVYRSPEERAGDAPDSRSTVYSLGALFIAAATGQLPPERFESRADNGRGTVPKLERVVEKAMSLDPDDRYDRPSAFVQALVEGIRERERQLAAPRTRKSRAPSNGAASAVAAKQAAEKAEQERRETEAALEAAKQAEARRQAEEAERQQAEEAEARRQAEEAERRQAEEAERRQAEETERRLAEEAEVDRLAEEAEARRLAEEAEARRQAEETERRRAEEADAERKAQEVEARRLAEEAEARRQAEEATRKEAEERRRAEKEASKREREERRHREAAAREEEKKAEELRRAEAAQAQRAERDAAEKTKAEPRAQAKADKQAAEIAKAEADAAKRAEVRAVLEAEARERAEAKVAKQAEKRQRREAKVAARAEEKAAAAAAAEERRRRDAEERAAARAAKEEEKRRRAEVEDSKLVALRSGDPEVERTIRRSRRRGASATETPAAPTHSAPSHTPQAPARSRGQWKKTGLFIGAAAVVGTVIGFAVAGNGGDGANDRELASGVVSLRLPAGWDATDATAKTPVPLSDTASGTSNDGAGIEVGMASSGPAAERALADSLPDAKPRAAVQLGELQAWRYSDLPLPRGQVGVAYLAYTTEAPLVVVCRAPRASADRRLTQCGNAAATAHLEKGGPVALAAVERAKTELRAALAELGKARVDGRAKFADARVAREQAAAGRSLKASFLSAAQRVDAIDYPATSLDGLATALRETGGAYGQLSAATLSGSAGAYDKARASVLKTEAKLRGEVVRVTAN